MIFILSSAYVSDEFQAEIGQIPPAFLPIGNKKLIERQLVSLREFSSDEEIILSLPQSFLLTETMKNYLESLKVKVQFVPDQFTLSEAVLYLLNTSGFQLNIHESISILYGDTYISDLSFAKNSDDIIAIAEAKISYAWEYVNDTYQDENLVWCGFFKFSNISCLLKNLALERKNFNQAIKNYAIKNEMMLYQTLDWHDLGHINTYFLARAQLTTQRSFNQLVIDDGVVYKSGEPQIKIKAEANWFLTIPAAIKKFTPLFLGAKIEEEKIGYTLEYLSSMPLNELFVHGYNNPRDWDIIFLEIQKFFEASCTNNEAHYLKDEIVDDFISLVEEKTFKRLEAFALENNVSLEQKMFYEGKVLPSISDIAKECIALVQNLPSMPAVLHGDLCFSNMLFDARGLRLKLIDPRGINVKNNLTIYGDAKYDLAKLTHSIIGLYDFIIAGHYQIQKRGCKEVSLFFDLEDRVVEIQNKFYELIFLEKLEIHKIIPIVILLFLSMLPLHSDRPDRQEAMLLNALRLYKQYL